MSHRPPTWVGLRPLRHGGAATHMFDDAFTDGGEIYSRGFWDMAEYERFEAHVMGGP
ncbi:hypothetical protein [Sorangium cellulosum]|nr:hypothetical protein [Sorangium cellulosum]